MDAPRGAGEPAMPAAAAPSLRTPPQVSRRCTPTHVQTATLTNPTQTFDTPSLIGRRWLPWPSSAQSECLTVSSSISSPLKSETTFLNRWVQVVSVGGGCEAQSGQQWVGGRCEGWTCNLQQLPAGSETEVHQGLVYSTAGKKEADLELLDGVTCYYRGVAGGGASGHPYRAGS